MDLLKLLHLSKMFQDFLKWLHKFVKIDTWNMDLSKLFYQINQSTKCLWSVVTKYAYLGAPNMVKCGVPEKILQNVVQTHCS